MSMSETQKFRINNLISNINLREDSVNFDGNDVEFCKYEFDPRVWFSSVIDQPTIPDWMVNQIMERLISLKDSCGKKIVYIVLNGRMECQLPSAWIAPLVNQLLENKFCVFVQNPSYFYKNDSKNTMLHFLDWSTKFEDVMKMNL